MRVAFVVSVLVAVALLIFIIGLASKRSLRRRKERVDLINEVNMLQSVFVLVNNEVKLQEDAGYSDVKAFRLIFDNNPEVLP